MAQAAVAAGGAVKITIVAEDPKVNLPPLGKHVLLLLNNGDGDIGELRNVPTGMYWSTMKHHAIDFEDVGLWADLPKLSYQDQQP